MPRYVLLLCAVLGLARGALAAPEGFVQVGDALFQVPPGWRQVELDSATLLVPPNVPEGKTAVLAIMPAQALTGDLRAWFDSQWADFTAGSTVVDGGEVVQKMARGGYEVVYSAAQLQDAAKSSMFAFVLAAQAGSQVQAFVYMTDDVALVAQHQDGLKTFLGSLTFASLQPPEQPAAAATTATTAGEAQVSPSFTWGEVPPAQGSAGLSGVYHMQDLGAEISVISGNAITDIEHTYWCFFPDGRCYYSLPEEGLDNFNYDYLRQAGSATFCCTYQMEGDNGLITWGNASKSTIGFHRVGNALYIKRDSDRYELLDPCDGVTLEGTFKRYDYQSEYSPTEGLTFTRDGKFVDEGFLHGALVMWRYLDRGYVDVVSAPGSGSYHLAHNSLVLLYADGRKLRISFQLADEVSRDDVTAFLLNTWRYVRVG